MPDTRDALATAAATTNGASGGADGKAAALLAALGLPSAVLVAVLPGRTIPAPAAPFVIAGAACLATAMVLSLLCIRSRLHDNLPGTWVYWATCDPDEIAKDASRPLTGTTVQRLARIALRKHRLLRAAIDVSIAAAINLALAGALALLCALL